MITKDGKEFLREIGVLAENIICEADFYDEKDEKESIIESMAETAFRIKRKTKLLSIADLKELLDKHNIVFVEYADMLYDAGRKIPYDNNEVKFTADAVVSIVLDITHREIRSEGDLMFTITATDRHGILDKTQIRRLTPYECLRAQGFSEEQAEKMCAVNSDNQLYKQAGNAVTINVVQAIGERLEILDEELNKRRKNIWTRKQV